MPTYKKHINDKAQSIKAWLDCKGFRRDDLFVKINEAWNKLFEISFFNSQFYFNNLFRIVWNKQ